jgi:hypothetical protein
MPAMSAPLILIVGSANPARDDYQPPLVNAQTAPLAAEHIGAELARRGCRIVVYSASKSFLEADVVRGYVAALKKNAKGMIEVRYPHTAPGSAEFAEAKNRDDLFVPKADRNASWEASFYASLPDAAGVLIIGGGSSAHAIGYMSLAQQLPILPLACFGGAAKDIWLAIRPGIDLPTDAQHQLMNPPAWRPDLAAGAVDALLAQADTLRDRARNSEMGSRGRRATQRIGGAVAVLIAATAITVWGFNLPTPHTESIFTWLLFFVGPLAGMGSALGLSGWKMNDDGRSIVTTAGLGFIAGLVSSLFYLLAQVSTASEPKDIKGLAIIVAMASGLIAGFTLDQVLKQVTEGKLKPPGRSIAKGDLPAGG